jgi:hypothetical protein
MSTKTQLINRFQEYYFNKPVGVEKNILITEEIDFPSTSNLEIKKSKKKYNYWRQAVSLSGRHFVEVPRNDPMWRLEKYGIFPRSKYTMEVYLQIAYLAGEKRSLDYIVEHMRKDFPALDEAHFSRKFVERVLLLTSAVVTPYLPMIAPLNRPWNLIIDGTVRTSGNSTLIIVLAHFPDDDSVFPLLANFLPSENKKDLNKILFELKDKLTILPQAVVSDFSKGFHTSLPEVFSESAILGCHFHAIELIARNLIYPSIRTLNKKIRLFINKLKSIIRQILHRNKRNATLRLFAQTLKQIISRHQGDFGRNLIIMIEKLKAVHDCLYENRKFFGSQYKQLKSLFSRQKWGEIENSAKQLAIVLEQFDTLRDCLRPDNLYTSERLAKKSLRKIITKWEKDKSILALQKAAETLNMHFDYLIPAMHNPNFPRTTSILEGLNNQVKRAMRHWCGTQQLPLSFEWVGELLSIIVGIGDITQWSGILTQIPLNNWISELDKLRIKEKAKRSEIRQARWLASLLPSSLHRQLEGMIKRDFMKEVMY